MLWIQFIIHIDRKTKDCIFNTYTHKCLSSPSRAVIWLWTLFAEKKLAIFKQDASGKPPDPSSQRTVVTLCCRCPPDYRCHLPASRWHWETDAILIPCPKIGPAYSPVSSRTLDIGVTSILRLWFHIIRTQKAAARMFAVKVNNNRKKTEWNINIVWWQMPVWGSSSQTSFLC